MSASRGNNAGDYDILSVQGLIDTSTIQPSTGTTHVPARPSILSMGPWELHCTSQRIENLDKIFGSWSRLGNMLPLQTVKGPACELKQKLVLVLHRSQQTSQIMRKVPMTK